MALTMTDGQERLIRSEQDDSRDVAQEHRHSLLAELDATRARVAEVERQQEDVKHHLVHLGLEPWHDGRSISDNKREWQQHIGMVLSSLVARLAAREAECAELMNGMEEAWGLIANARVWDDASTPDEWTHAAQTWRDNHWHPALSRPSGDYAALRKMLVKAWEAGYLRGCGGCNPTDGPPWDEDDCRNRDVAVARLLERSDDPKGLPPATQAQEGVAE